MHSSNLLSDVDTLATYDFTTFCIDFYELDSNILDDILNFESVVKSQNIYKITQIYEAHRLINHECQHFLDATSTLWGVTLLKKMKDGYLSKDIPAEKNPEYNNYFKAQIFYKEFLSVKYPPYYSLLHPEVEENGKWSLVPTIGNAFGKEGKPSDFTILFARYFNEKNESFARTPVSLITLLECSAVIQEMHTSLKYINVIKDRSVRNIHFNKIKSYFFKTLFNRELTEYSSCFHIVANKIRCHDGFLILPICEVLIELSLNCSDSCFERLKKLSFDTKSKEFNSNIIKGLECRNRGVLFFLLNFISVDKVYRTKKDFIRRIDIFLKTVGLSYSEIMKQAESEISILLAQISSDNHPIFTKIAESSSFNFKKLYREKYYEEKYSVFDDLHFPKALFYADDSYKQLNINNAIGSLNPIEMNESFSEAFNWCKSFSDACFV